MSNGPVDWYSGETLCNGVATTGEDLGPYTTQQGSKAGFPATAPVLVKNHSESDIQVDPTDPKHLIGSSKWFASAEGYNHVLGFYGSWDGGKTWPVQGHIPGYGGWTDNTDPVGAFDGFGNYYELILPYQFDYKPDGSKQFSTGQEPNPSVSNEAVSVAVRPHGAKTAQQWITTHNAHPNTDEFQPNLATAADGSLSVNFYDRRLSCPASGTTEAVAAGLSRDTVNPNYSGSLPP